MSVYFIKVGSPATAKSLECNIDRKSGSPRQDFALASAQTLAGKVVGASSAGLSHFSGQFFGRFQCEILPGRSNFSDRFCIQANLQLPGQYNTRVFNAWFLADRRSSFFGVGWTPQIDDLRQAQNACIRRGGLLDGI